MSGFPRGSSGATGTAGGALTGTYPNPSLLPQALAEAQDVTSRGGSVRSADITTGMGPVTTVAAASTGLTLAQIVTATQLFVAAAVGPSSNGPVQFFGATGAACQIRVATSGGVATLSYTSTTGGVTPSYNGIAIVSGTGTWTVATGNLVYGQPLPIMDLYAGDSITRGDGSVLGVNDWPTTLANIENFLAGLQAQNTGFVLPFYSDTGFSTTNLQWASTAAGAASTVGSPVVQPNSGAGGAYASSVKISAAGSVGDTRSFRRVIIFFQNIANADKITFATTGQVVTSPQITPSSGTGIGYWDSGDLGYNGAGTGFTATWAAGGGQGVVLIGALYIQTAGVNGVVNVNIAKGSTYSGDWATTTAGFAALASFMASAGYPFRRFVCALGINDADVPVGGVTSPSQLQANLGTIAAAVEAVSPLTEIVLPACYYAGYSFESTQVGAAAWSASWVPAIRSAAVGAGATFVDLFSRFGDCSYIADPYGLTMDSGVHFGTNANSRSGTNGQQAIAECFFEKLEYSKNFNQSGTVVTGNASDGKAVTVLGGGTSGGKFIGAEYFLNANDGNPAVEFFASTIAGLPTGVYFGLGGGNLLDTSLTRIGAGKVAVSNNLFENGEGIVQGGSDTSAIVAVGAVAFVSGTARQMPVTTQDSILMIQVTTGGTMAIAYGPTSGVADTLFTSATVVVGSLYTFKIPAGWWVDVTLTAAVITARYQTA